MISSSKTFNTKLYILSLLLLLITTITTIVQGCEDSTRPFLVNKKDRTCSWVAKGTTKRCAKGNYQVATHCPVTCGTCDKDKCKDAAKRFYLETNGNLKSCLWVRTKDTEKRCKKIGDPYTCRASCGYCDIPNQEVYEKNPTGIVSYNKMINRNPDCMDYEGSYTAEVDDLQENVKLYMDFTISYDTDKCIFSSNNIPNHNTGGSTTNGNKFATQVQPNKDPYVLHVPRNPVRTSTPIFTEKLPGEITMNGIMLNGVDMDVDSAFCYNPAYITAQNPLGIALFKGDIRCGQDADWYAVPAANPSNVVLDEFTGHSYNGRYHYHGDNDALSYLKAADVYNEYGSPVIGFAPDGFPIYGHFFYDVDSGGIRKAKSSYQHNPDFVQNGERDRPDGAEFDPPSIDTHELGLFVEDFKYVAESGDLDECNGMEDAFGNYAYYYTEDYPYAPLCTFGVRDETFDKSACSYNNPTDTDCDGSGGAFRNSFVTSVVESSHSHSHHDHGIDESGASTSLSALSYSVCVVVVIAATIIGVK